MTDTDKIRVLIQDVPVHQQDVVEAALRVQLSHFPVVDGSVIITPTCAFTVSLQTGQVLVDTLPVGADTLALDYDYTMLSDEALQVFLDVENVAAEGDADIRLAAADALDAMATSQAIILKKIKLQDAQFDGPAVAKALRDHAEMLRKQVFSGDFDEPCFDIVEQVYQPFGLQERLLKDVMRQS